MSSTSSSHISRTGRRRVSVRLAMIGAALALTHGASAQSVPTDAPAQAAPTAAAMPQGAPPQAAPPAGAMPQGMPPSGGFPPGGPPPGGFPAGGPPPGGFPPGGPPSGLPPLPKPRPYVDPDSVPEKAVYADAAALELRLGEDPPLTDAQKVAAAIPVSPMAAMAEPPLLRSDARRASSDPRDFSGVWFHDLSLRGRILRDLHGKLIPFTMAGARVLERRSNADKAGKPFQNGAALCRPPGIIWQADVHMPFMIFQNKAAVEFVFQDYRGRLNLVLDSKLLQPGRSYMGTAMAHWDGDTLVADTSGFKQGLWLDIAGTPVSKDAHLINRIRKIDTGDHKPLLEIETTIVDPQYYTAPWTIVRTFRWQPNMPLFDEYNCELQIGDPNVPSDAGLVPEPADLP
jgi:hypothetical protein